MSAERTSLFDARVLDGLRAHPAHWKSLGAGGGFAAIRCLDCGFEAKGGYHEVVVAWNAHLPKAAT